LARITIDYTPAYEQGGGIGRYVRELVSALASIDNQTSYNLFVAGATILPDRVSENFVWQLTSISPRWFARLWYRLRFPLPVEFFAGRASLYHATDFVLPPTLPATKTLLTVHDLSFLRVPESASPRLRAYLSSVVPHSVHRANHVLADSQATKDDIVSIYGVDPSKVTVLLSGVDSRFFPVVSSKITIRNKYAIGDRPYLFSVGTVQPRKNYSRIIRALSVLRSKGFDIVLVIAGGKGWLEDEMYRTIIETRMTDYVKLIGFADEADLPTLYSAASCLVFPSLYEGFGLPVLESMACGTPVITANVSSLPEVGGDAAILINPYDLDELVNAIERVLTSQDLRQDMIQRGLERVKGFTWEKSARQLKQIYDMLLSD